MMGWAAKHALIRSYDESRAAFLASIDQVVSEVRPFLAGGGADRYGESIVSCAGSFASRELVRSQLEEVSPALSGGISDEDLGEAHLVTVSYLFSLMLHETIRAASLAPTMTERSTDD